MKIEYIKYIVISLIVLFLISRMLPVKAVNNLMAGEVKSRLKNKKIQYIDVRTPNKFRSGHVKQFKNVPLQTFKNQANTLDKNKVGVIICRSRSRSMKACRILKKEGFENLTNVRGRINMW